MRAFLAVWFLAAPSMLVAAEKLSPGELARRIDDAIQTRIEADKAAVAPAADDAEFIRRVYLDLHGVVPPAERVAAFLASQQADKRGRLIEDLLESPEYGEHFGLVWYNRMVPRAARNRGVVSDAILHWLAGQFNQNKGWDRIVSELLLAEGPRDQSPGTIFYLAALSDDPNNPQPEPSKLTAALSRLFLGVRLECCQCHDHPFAKIKQAEFWGLAAFFINVRADNLTAGPKASPTIKEGIVVAPWKGFRPGTPISTKAMIEIPESSGTIAQARFLGGPDFLPKGEVVFRKALTDWVVSPENPNFARAAVNRTWAHFFGRGLVEPIDDMRPENAPTHPELLDLLTAEFIASGFDQKYLMRTIANTAAYQRTSVPPAGSSSEPHLYVHMAARVMTADQLFDSLTRILGHPVGARITSGGQKRKYGDARERFRAFFQGGGDDENIPAPAYGHGIPQVLRLMNEPSLTDGDKLIKRLAGKRGFGAEQVVNELYLTTLARYPTSAERQSVARFLAAEPDRTRGYADLLWVLLNSGEFLHNH